MEIERRIHVIRGREVMLDSDLAELYGVETGNLNKAVGRNPDRFPEDFMFQLSGKEREILRFQIGSLRWGAHSKYQPRVFTEQGVAMLSSVLRSPRAVQVNIEIMRTFSRLRKALAINPDLAARISEIERRLKSQELTVAEHGQALLAVFQDIRRLLEPPRPKRKRRRISAIRIVTTVPR
jgi:hypothetical protein